MKRVMKRVMNMDALGG